MVRSFADAVRLNEARGQTLARKEETTMTRFTIIAAAAAVAIATIPAMPVAAQSLTRVDQRMPGGPNGPATESAQCGSSLGPMARVYPAEIAGVTNQTRVWVTEICEHESLLHNEGNAAYLRPYIADNAVLVSVLGDRSFFPEDVYAVKMMGDDTINLFVHHFD
jgi:hypothetical protein